MFYRQQKAQKNLMIFFGRLIVGCYSGGRDDFKLSK